MSKTKFSAEVLRDEKAPAIALLGIVLTTYGVDAFQWQPEFLRDELEKDFSVSISDLQSDKIQAALVVLTTDLFQSQWEVFKTVCHLLNNTPDTFEDSTSLEAEELISALAHYHLLVGTEDLIPFSDEVNAGAGVVFYNYGLSVPPTLFQTALMPEHAVSADPTEKNQALGEIYDARKQDITSYAQSMINASTS